MFFELANSLNLECRSQLYDIAYRYRIGWQNIDCIEMQAIKFQQHVLQDFRMADKILRDA